MSTKFLSLSGLDKYDELIKSYIDTGLAGKSGSTHIHDDRYYTESEIDTKLSTINENVDKITSGDTVVKKAETATSATNATNASTATIAKDSEKLGGQLPSYYAKASDIPTGTLASKNSVSESDLDSALAEKVNAASEGNHSHSNKTVLDGITSEKVSAWDSSLDSAKTYTDSKLSGKSDTSHNHDDKYDAKGASTASLSQSKAYTDEKIALLLNNSSEAVDSIYELRDAMVDNADAIEALETIAGNKADKTHGHAISDVTNLQSTLDGKAAKSTFDTHVASTVSHVTANERNAWNAKASTASATTATAGLMTPAMVTKLNGIEEGANKYSHPTTSGNKHIPSGGASGQFLKWSADGTAVWAADNDTKYAAGTGIALNGTTFSNSGVRSVVTGTTNGTIIVNTNGTTAAVPVKGLGNAAYTSIDTALSSTSTNAVQNKVVNSAISTLTTSVTTNANSITTLSNAIAAIEEITLQEIESLFQ